MPGKVLSTTDGRRGARELIGGRMRHTISCIRPFRVSNRLLTDCGALRLWTDCGARDIRLLGVPIPDSLSNHVDATDVIRGPNALKALGRRGTVITGFWETVFRRDCRRDGTGCKLPSSS